MTRQTILRVLLAVWLIPMVAGTAFYLWAAFKSGRSLSRQIDSHSAEFPIPFPLSADEVRELNLTPDSADRLAHQRAFERGRHLVEARYACGECHGSNFGGGTMVDSRLLGRFLGPNLTGGIGGRTAAFSTADWDRAVRHGILPGGKPSSMPSQDFQQMSDQELSDIIVFLRSQPRFDNQVAAFKLGPLGKVLVATGALKLPVDLITSHTPTHAILPPEAAATEEFGKHLAGTCTGCHQADLAGGPITGGDPSWGPAANLTPHATGLGSWSYQQFVATLTDGKRPDGTPLKAPMTSVLQLTRKMTELEMQALWKYLQSLPAVAARS